MLTGFVLLFSAAAHAQDAMASSGTGSTSFGGQDYYIIQPGDTLWDISQQFLGDAQAWPGLWSLNEYITNPHWIYPGNRIYFHLGDDLNPPGVGLDDAGEKPYQAPVAQSDNNAPLCDFPPLFVDKVDGLKVIVPGVLSTARDLNIRGEVFASEAAGIEIGERTVVYLHMDDADKLDCGDVVGIYRKESGKTKVGGTNGYIYRIIGDARVIRVDGDTVSAQLRDNVREVERGDLIGDPTPFRMQLDVSKPDGDLRGKIVARLNSEQSAPADYETVFLDVGTEEGVDVGTTLYIVEQRDGQDVILTNKEDDRIPERVVGRVVVVRADDDSATAVVVDAAHEIDTGMRLASNPNGKDD